MTKLKEKDVRIILGNFNESWARRVFCEAHRYSSVSRSGCFCHCHCKINFYDLCVTVTSSIRIYILALWFLHSSRNMKLLYPYQRPQESRHIMFPLHFSLPLSLLAYALFYLSQWQSLIYLKNKISPYCYLLHFVKRSSPDCPFVRVPLPSHAAIRRPVNSSFKFFNFQKKYLRPQVEMLYEFGSIIKNTSRLKLSLIRD